MPVNDGNLSGWPFVNHAMELRGTQTSRGASRQSIVYPRRKFTYIVEFVINDRALDANRRETNITEFLQNGRIYATLKSIEHPKPTMQTEKLRSYNKHVIIPTKFEYQPATMGFHDDNSSMATALWKEIRSFYHYEGKIGRTAITQNALTRNLLDEFRAGNALTGTGVRASTEDKPSMGMRIKEDDGRHFFDAITIYDLGADPDSVNVYTFMYPVVTSLEQDGLDYEDRTGQVGLNMTFDYEGYYQLVGVNNAQFHEVIEQFLGFRPATTSPNVAGHARMIAGSENVSFPTSLLESPVFGALGSVVDTLTSGSSGFLPDTDFDENPPSDVAGPGDLVPPEISETTLPATPSSFRDVVETANLSSSDVEYINENTFFFTTSDVLDDIFVAIPHPNDEGSLLYSKIDPENTNLSQNTIQEIRSAPSGQEVSLDTRSRQTGFFESNLWADPNLELGN